MVTPAPGCARQCTNLLGNFFADRRENSSPRWLMVFGAVALAGLGVAGAAGPQQIGADAPITFQIPAQPLATALQAYGQRAGVQVLYESDSAAGRQSVAVEGQFTRNQALELLLSGSNLEVHYTKSDAITIAPRNVGGKDEPPADPLVKADLSIGELRVHAPSQSGGIGPLQDYSESVQLDIQSALRKNPKTRSGNYRAVLDLWIDSARVIQRTAMLQSTGEADRDTAVTAALQGLTTSRPPPANAPQPIRVVIVVKSGQ
jgi:Secretin and TonB N terminus short domain/TonB C terminal